MLAFRICIQTVHPNDQVLFKWCSEKSKVPPPDWSVLGSFSLLTHLSMHGWWSRFISWTSLNMLARLLLSLFIFRAITWSEAR